MKRFEFYLLYLLANFMRLYLDLHLIDKGIVGFSNVKEWERFTSEFISRLEKEYGERK